MTMAFDAERGTGHLPVGTLEVLAEVGRGRRTITPDDPLAALFPPGWPGASADLGDVASTTIAALAAVLSRPELRIGIERHVAGATARCAIAWTRQATVVTGAPDRDGRVAVTVTAPRDLADVILGAARLRDRPAAPAARCQPQALADAVDRGRGPGIAGTTADQLVLVRIVVTAPDLDPDAAASAAHDLLDGDDGLWRVGASDDVSGELTLAPWSAADEHARWTAIRDRLAADTTAN